MKLNRIFAAAAMLGLMAAVTPAFAQGADEVSAQTVVTVLEKTRSCRPLREQDLKVQVGGKSANVTDLIPLRGDRAGLELVILIDGSARTSLGTQMGDIQRFVQSCRPPLRSASLTCRMGSCLFAAIHRG